MGNKNKKNQAIAVDIQERKPVEIPGKMVEEKIAVGRNLRGEVEFCIKMCEKSLTSADFNGIDASGTNDLSIAYSRIQSAITRLKIARDKL